MPPFVAYIIRRLLTIPITLFVLTAALYGIAMLAPVEARAELYMPNTSTNNPDFDPQVFRQRIIKKYGLNDPYLAQYARWVTNLVRGDWGWSPGMRDGVLHALLVRTPTTIELTLYSVILLVPLGIISGVAAGAKQGKMEDFGFRLVAFVGASIPPFIMGLVLLGIFYAGLRWFPAGRISTTERFFIQSADFTNFTGLLTIDGILNGRMDITVSAFRHLFLPVITLSLAHWATLGRVTRATIIEELGRDYIVTAHGKGAPKRTVVWLHALRNVMVPALNSTALSAASLIMGVFVVEAVFGLHGVSELITGSLSIYPDIPTALGFAVYSVLLVLPLMLILDILQGVVDPRIREGIGQL